LLQGSQGTFGIITWSTIKCEVLPRIQKPFIAAGEDLETLLEFGYRLVRLRLGDELFILNGKNLASLLEKDGEAIRDLKEALPTWVLLFCLAGYEYLPEERVEYQEKDVKEVGQRIGVKISEAVAGISAEKLLRTASNPSEEPYWKIREKGGCQDIYFITSFNAVPKLVNLMGEICGREGYPPLGGRGLHPARVSGARSPLRIPSSLRPNRLFSERNCQKPVPTGEQNVDGKWCVLLETV